MPLNYSITLLPNPIKPDEAKKAYAKAQVNRELSLAAQTTVSRADVYAVIISTVENMVDALRAGDQVDFGELGKFRLQISSKGADSAESFTSNHITGVNIQFVPGDDLKNIFQGMEFTPVPTRRVRPPWTSRRPRPATTKTTTRIPEPRPAARPAARTRGTRGRSGK